MITQTAHRDRRRTKKNIHGFAWLWVSKSSREIPFFGYTGISSYVPCFCSICCSIYLQFFIFRKTALASFCCLLLITPCSPLPPPLLPASRCSLRSVRRRCWSVCWRSCGSWWWTPWRRPSCCRRSQTRRWGDSLFPRLYCTSHACVFTHYVIQWWFCYAINQGNGTQCWLCVS